MRFLRQSVAVIARTGARLVALTLLALSISCGGGGSSSGPPPPPPQPLQFTAVSMTPILAGKPYSYTFQASGGTLPYTWSVASGASSLPAGLSLSSSGVLSGTAAEPSYSPYYFGLDIKVTDSAGQSVTSYCSSSLIGLLHVYSATLFPGNVGLPYNQAVSAYGGLPPYTLSLASNSPPLPSGLTLNSSGTISGTTLVPGTFDLVVQVQDAAPSSQTATGHVSLTIGNNLVATTTTLPLGVVGQPYKEFVTAAGGTPPYTFSTSYVPFAGLALLPTGEVSGTPTSSLNSSCNFTLTDSASPPNVVYGYFFLNIRPVLTIVSTTLNDGIRTFFYSRPIIVDGGRPPFSVRITTGSLPTGLTLSNTGANNGYFDITGAPTALGTFNFTVEASDSSTPPGIVTQSLAIRVVDLLSLPLTDLPNTLAGTPFSATFTASGGVPPYSWYVYGQPNGLAIDRDTGVLSGTPTIPNNYTLGLSVWDQTIPSQVAYRAVSLKIVAPLSISTTSLPSVMVGVPVQIGVSAFGGIGSYTWTIVSGSLPAGLTFDTTTGKITGTPTMAESKTITLRVDDAGPPAQNYTNSLAMTSSNALGRNDSIATATPLSNGTYLASLSPADDTSGTTNPDNDYYAVTANTGAVVGVEITAQRLTPKSSPMDSVIEILDAAGTRFATCSNSNSYGFYLSCMNDDSASVNTLDSKLFFQVPGTPGGAPVTFYVRVLDWSGMARPDFLYTITISGAN